jgi:hypothetical protein
MLHRGGPWHGRNLQSRELRSSLFLGDASGTETPRMIRDVGEDVLGPFARMNTTSMNTTSPFAHCRRS